MAENRTPRGVSFPGLPDREERERVLRELDTNILVEAAAGTGKTTSMVGRMLALLESGRCEDIRRMAAVTFTRKAAAELRGRFQMELEKRAREAGGAEGKRLRQALDRVEQCFTGTIHSFCARLLRERPVEAGVDLAFEEIDEEADKLLREEAWEAFSAGLLVHDPGGMMERLDRAGLRLGDLRSAFEAFSLYPDVEDWPLPADRSEPDLAWAREELLRYAERLAGLAPRLPRDVGNDTLIPKIKSSLRALSHLEHLERPVELVEALELFDAGAKAVQKEWMKTGYFSREDVKDEEAAWNDFRERVARPALRAWREYRYPLAMEVLHAARETYDRMRHERGLLNFQDLLMKAAALLRGNPGVRRYFQARFTHLLVDEFQDTDPIQAEVILLLASSDPEERDWRSCVPRPGSLFLVGDPKQSIYRFRRADIATYAEVKRILTSRGGKVVELRSNFRSAPPVISWVNRVFEPGEPLWDEKGRAMLRFPAEDAEESPRHVPLHVGGEEGSPGELCGVYRLRLPQECANNEAVREQEPDLVARFIRHALDGGMTVPRTRGQLAQGIEPAARPQDFMIVTRTRKNLGAFAQALQRYGIPHRVTGGQALNELEELRLLYLCLRSVTRPDDPVALVAALRSELFGLSDAELYAFRKAGGRFSYRAEPPAGLEPETAAAFADAFERLRRYGRWLSLLPHAAACEKTAEDLGLFALAAARAGGDVEAGSLAKALELLRAAQDEAWSAAQLVEYLGKLVEREEEHDGISALSGTRPAVEIMNLHKVKGLEAPVVFLADPCGEYEHGADVHIDRSGGKILGYLALCRETPGSRSRKLLAHPAGWEALAERELAFRRAEELRLRYVAATRSRAATVISQRAKRNSDNPWCYFEPHIDPGYDLPDPGAQSAPAVERAALSMEEIARGAADVPSRLEAAMSPTYDARAAREFARSLREAAAPVSEAGGPIDASPPLGEHGVEWGQVVHLLLQAGMDEPEADLERLAAGALAEREMDVSLAAEAAGLARSVMGSEIWRRAQASERRLVEVPFQVMQRVMRQDGTPLPTVLRGVIDLIFREDDGWVLVDYKTDRLEGKTPAEAAREHAAQVRLYARAWESCTGEAVKQTYLYFTSAGALVEVAGGNITA